MAEEKKRRILPWVVAALTGGLAGPALGIGTDRLMEAKDLSNTSIGDWKKQKGFQDYTTPQSYTDELGLRKTQTRQEMPGLSQQRQDINAATANTLSSAQNLGGADSAAVLLGAGQDRLRALRQLGIAASQYGSGRQEAYTQAVGRGAGYEDMAYQQNISIPWQTKQNEEMGYRNTGTQMIIGGLDKMAGVATQGMNLGAQQQWFNNMSPQQGQGYNPYQGGGMNPAWNPTVPSGYGQYNPPYQPSPYFTG